MPLDIQKKEFDDLVMRIGKDLKTWMMQGIAKGMDIIGIIATSKHMINPGGRTNAVDSKRITSRSGRTARSLAPQGGALTPSGSREQIRSIKGATDGVKGEFGSRVDYLPTHEFGATINQTVTARQIAFFWAKWFESGEDVWKASALKFMHKSKTLQITVPARPVISPAVKEAMPRVFDIMEKAVVENL